MTSATLPEPFRDLEPFLDWALPTERERMARRHEQPLAAITEFHTQISTVLACII